MAPCPHSGRLATGAKMAVPGVGQPSPDQAAAPTVFDRFATAGAYLRGVPMWNAGVHCLLKEWIDITTEP